MRPGSAASGCRLQAAGSRLQASGHSLQLVACSLQLTRGFTLVELLIVASLMTFISGVIVATLTGGFRVWARAADYGTYEQASLIALEELRRDLSSARRFALIPFEGEHDQMSFPTVRRAAGEATGPEELGREGYYVDSRHRVLCHSFVPFRVSRRWALHDRCDVVLDGVQRAAFEYFGVGETGGDPAWSSSWKSEEPPAAVKVSVTLETGKRQSMTRTMLIALPNGPGKPKPDK